MITPCTSGDKSRALPYCLCTGYAVPSEEYTQQVARLSVYKCVPGAVWAEC